MAQGSQHALRTQIIISSTLHHFSKSDFRHHLILPVLFSLPLRDFGFSIPVIVIVKICVSSFDMVAEHQCHDSGQCSFATSCPVQSSHDDSTTTRPTNQITSSSGEKENSLWTKIQEEPDINVFSNDPKFNPRLPSPTSFDGVKLSYIEWSEEVLTFLSVTDYQELVPILQAVSGHKSGVRVENDQDTAIERIKGEITILEQKRDSRGLTLMKADSFLRYVLLHSTSSDPNIMVRRIMRTSKSDSEVVIGLESWRQMAVTYAGSAQTRIVTLLKQIMTPSEWNPEKSSNVLQMYHHWLELISKYESLSSERIASNIKITLALQNVRGPLANALSFSITEKSTWNDIHNLLINHFNNSIPSDTKGDLSVRHQWQGLQGGFSKSSRQKGKGYIKEVKGSVKGQRCFSEPESKRQGEVIGTIKKERLNQKEGQWTTWSGQSWSWNQNQGQGGKGKGKGHQVCSHCGRKGHSVDQCW